MIKCFLSILSWSYYLSENIGYVEVPCEIKVQSLPILMILVRASMLVFIWGCLTNLPRQYKIQWKSLRCCAEPLCAVGIRHDYCPGRTVTRQQFAVQLHNAWSNLMDKISISKMQWGKGSGIIKLSRGAYLVGGFGLLFGRTFGGVGLIYD